ncbi:MAG: sulfurtransferase TusA family protein [Candidatus Schekmanbacteria bacterium]|nr:sulfurtransferase TusA family protein [Candidatus Schekmanbacteria bacterium]
MKDIKIDLSLDTLGYYCPVPIVKTAKALHELQAGQVLEVIADDAGIKKDLPAWCKTTGHEFLGLEEKAGEFRGYIKKR